MKNKEKRVQFFVAVGSIVIQRRKLLLGKRSGIYEHGTWSLPGGHLESKESIEDGARRELFEETGLKCKKIVIDNIDNQKQKDGKNYLIIGLRVVGVIGEPKNMEPQKCSELKWFDLDKIPKNLNRASRGLLKNFI